MRTFLKLEKRKKKKEKKVVASTLLVNAHIPSLKDNKIGQTNRLKLKI